jgi:hypothetical protein
MALLFRRVLQAGLNGVQLGDEVEPMLRNRWFLRQPQVCSATIILASGDN